MENSLERTKLVLERLYNKSISHEFKYVVVNAYNEVSAGFVFYEDAEDYLDSHDDGFGLIVNLDFSLINK
jgi:hypothetical protein